MKRYVKSSYYEPYEKFDDYRNDFLEISFDHYRFTNDSDGDSFVDGTYPFSSDSNLDYEFGSEVMPIDSIMEILFEAIDSCGVDTRIPNATYEINGTLEIPYSLGLKYNGNQNPYKYVPGKKPDTVEVLDVAYSLDECNSTISVKRVK